MEQYLKSKIEALGTEFLEKCKPLIAEIAKAKQSVENELVKAEEDRKLLLAQKQDNENRITLKLKELNEKIELATNKEKELDVELQKKREMQSDLDKKLTEAEVDRSKAQILKDLSDREYLIQKEKTQELEKKLSDQKNEDKRLEGKEEELAQEKKRLESVEAKLKKEAEKNQTEKTRLDKLETDLMLEKEQLALAMKKYKLNKLKGEK